MEKINITALERKSTFLLFGIIVLHYLKVTESEEGSEGGHCSL